MSRDWTPDELQAVSTAMKDVGHLSYEEFTAAVDAENKARERIAAFAETQTDGVHFCPRCGRMTVKDRLHTNALSRHADVTICDECGVDEALRDFAHDPLPLNEWAIAKLPLVKKG